MHRNYIDKYLLLALGILFLGDAFAIDGNYAAPYGSQWDSRSQVAAIPLETMFAVLLVLLNLIGAALTAYRERKRQKSN